MSRQAGPLAWEAVPSTIARLVHRDFGLVPESGPPVRDHPALGWRRAGLMAVTGRPDGPGLVPPAALTTLADSALDLLRRMSGSAILPSNSAVLLGERARLMGLTRRGPVSANGSCRLIESRDGFIALNLPREDDWDLAAAMVQQPVDDWDRLATIVRVSDRAELLERGRLLGLAIAPDQPVRAAARPFTVERFPCIARRGDVPLVVDLSSLWAGPLAGALLADVGARVVKVESVHRPDGARRGNPEFFTLLNGAKEAVAFDFRDPDDLARLRALVRQADIIIEASRPRALRQLGIDARTEAARGATWLSITAYGREGVSGDAIGFGDDVAVAAGLTTRLRDIFAETLFAGDAIADPLTGILAALTGWAGWQAGGGSLVSLAMTDVVGFACGFGPTNRADALQWQHMAEADEASLYPLRDGLAPCTSGSMSM